MGYSDNPNGSDFTIVTDVLQYRVFPREDVEYVIEGRPCWQTWSRKATRRFGGSQIGKLLDWGLFSICCWFLSSQPLE